MKTFKNVKHEAVILSAEEKSLLQGGISYYIGKRQVSKKEYKEFAIKHKGYSDY